MGFLKQFQREAIEKFVKHRDEEGYSIDGNFGHSINFWCVSADDDGHGHERELLCPVGVSVGEGTCAAVKGMSVAGFVLANELGKDHESEKPLVTNCAYAVLIRDPTDVEKIRDGFEGRGGEIRCVELLRVVKVSSGGNSSRVLKRTNQSACYVGLV